MLNILTNCAKLFHMLFARAYDPFHHQPVVLITLTYPVAGNLLQIFWLLGDYKLIIVFYSTDLQDYCHT